MARQSGHGPMIDSLRIADIVARTVAVFALFALLATPLTADDVGITEVRLIEEEGNTYALEADVSPFQLQTIEMPILPARATMLGEPELISVGQMIVVRFRFSTDFEPLGPADRILLPWQRSGVVITSYWLDGSSKRAYFDRRLEGISISISDLKAVETSLAELMTASVSDAIEHLRVFGWLHVLLVLGCLAAGPGRQAAGLLVAFAAGHGLALPAVDLGLPTVPPFVATLSLAAGAVVLYRTAILKREEFKPRLWPVLLVVGLIHGSLYTGRSVAEAASLSTEDLIAARFAFNLSVDVFHVVVALLGWLVIFAVRRLGLAASLRSPALYGGGGLVIAAAIVLTPGSNPTIEPSADFSSRVGAGVRPSGGATGTVSRPVEVTDPLMGFVTVTPFEVRVEWLVRVRDLDVGTAIDESGREVVPVDAQASFKTALVDRFTGGTLLTVDGNAMPVSNATADFVTVGSYGVTTRTEPIPEPIEDAVVGITLAYPAVRAPSSVEVELRAYPSGVEVVPVAVTDPWGSTPQKLTDATRIVEWEKRMAGFRRPVVRSVQIPPPSWPVCVAPSSCGRRRHPTQGTAERQLRWPQDRRSSLCRRGGPVPVCSSARTRHPRQGHAFEYRNRAGTDTAPDEHLPGIRLPD